MVLRIEQTLGCKNNIRILRYFISKPYLVHGLTEISNELNISKSNVLRVMDVLVGQKLILEKNTGRKKVYLINAHHALNRELYEIFMIESQNALDPEFKNILDALFAKLGGQTEIFVVFGSVAHGIQNKSSDIDICVVGNKKISGLRFDFSHKIEIHNYSLEDFKKISDFVVLECLMNGIWYKGSMFERLSQIDSVSKSYIIYRLNKAKQLIRKSKSCEGEARQYFLKIAEVIVGEICSILKDRVILPKRKINIKITDKLLRKIEEKIASEGDKIWIT